MRNLIIPAICLLSLISCERVWVEDLQEKAYDTIRGIYEIESVTWEEPDPIDINGDGDASYDYLAEWNSVYYGSPAYNLVSNEQGILEIPVIIDDNASWGGRPILARRTEQYRFGIKAIVEKKNSHLEFDLPEKDAEFSQSGYGEISLRTDVTLTVLSEPDRTSEVTGTIFIKYIRTEYRGR